MSAVVAVFGEVAKLPAFLRRDLLGGRRRRAAFAGDLLALGGQLVVLAFVGRLVDPDTLPAYGGTQVSFLDYVTIGLAIGLAVGVTVIRCVVAFRQDQLQGTFESMLVTPTAVATLHLGSIVLDLLWLPLRIALFLLVSALVFGLDYQPAGVGQTAALVVAFLPFAWGLGLIAAAATVRLRRGIRGPAVAVAVLVVVSGAYFPLSVLPGWVEISGAVNPVAVALEGVRGALLGGRGWDGVAADLAMLVPASALALAVGATLFHAALRRELRDGTLGVA
jgi:ABC-2 type transport system permease protein